MMMVTNTPQNVHKICFRVITDNKQECIPVGCVPPACCPYLPVCTAPRGMYLVPGGVPGLGGTCPEGCTWSREWLGVPGPREVYLVLGGVPGPGGCAWSGEWVYLVPGGYLPRYSPPVNRMTDRCKNITLPQTSFADSNKQMLQ